MTRRILSLGTAGTPLLKLSDGRSQLFSTREAASAYIALDCSGSMEGAKLGPAKRSSLQFAKHAIARGYRVGLISFASEATHFCDPTESPANLEPSIQSLSTEGGTNMLAAVHLARGRLSSPARRTLVIVTDGMPSEPDEAVRAAERTKREGIRILAIGTDDADWDFLKRLASEPGLGLKVAAAQLG